MKKLFAILLAGIMLLSLAACTPSNQEQPQSVEEFYFTYNNTKIALNAPMADVLAALGEPKCYSESPSCAFEGLDKTYGYGSFYIQTYPVGDKDYVYSFWFVDDMVETNEGICIGSAQADVEAAYDTQYYNGSTAFDIPKGNGKLTIILDDFTVTSIQYVIIAE